MSILTQLATMATRTEPRKASLTCLECPGLSFDEVQFNPASLKLDRSVSWSEGGEAMSPWGTLSYAHGKADELSFELLFDQSEYRPSTSLSAAAIAVAPVGGPEGAALARLAGWSNSDSVTYDVRRLYQLTMPIKAVDGNAASTMRPPVVQFHFGDFGFQGVVDSLDVELGLFDQWGMPRRCTVSLELKGRAAFDDAHGELFDATYSPSYSASAGATSDIDSRISKLLFARLWG